MIEVRAATINDLAQIAQVAEAAWRNAYAGLITSEAIQHTMIEWYSAEMLSRRLDWGGLDVAVHGDEVVGFLQHRGTEHGTHEVYAIYIRPDLIGTGVGGALWQRADRVMPDGRHRELRYRFDVQVP